MPGDSAFPRDSGLVADSVPSTDTAPTEDTSEGGDTAPSTTVCVPGETSSFRIPDGRWALAVLYASRRYDDLESSHLVLSPAWFLASAWQRTGFGCSSYGGPWAEDAAWSGDPGCMGLYEHTHWSDLCRLYPDSFACGAYSGAVGGEHIEAAVMATAWFSLAAHALLQRDDDDLEAWYASATDPLAVEKISALTHYSGAWIQTALDVLDDCSDADVLDCMQGEEAHHVSSVVEKMDTLAHATCYDEPIAVEDLEHFTEELALLWPEEDWTGALGAAEAALTGGGFSEDGLRVMDAIEGVVDVRLLCPEETLWSWFQLSCP